MPGDVVRGIRGQEDGWRRGIPVFEGSHLAREPSRPPGTVEPAPGGNDVSSGSPYQESSAEVEWRERANAPNKWREVRLQELKVSALVASDTWANPAGAI